MDRVHAVENMMLTILEEIGSEEDKIEAINHLTAVAKFSFLLAKIRGENAELAYIAGTLHDLYAFTHERKEHAANGSVLALGILRSLNIFKEDEIDSVCYAIRHHSDKKRIHDPLSEILKDADVLDHYFSSNSFCVSLKDAERLKNLSKELNLSL